MVYNLESFTILVNKCCLYNKYRPAGGFLLVETITYILIKSFSADTVECLLWKPCWKSGIGRFSFNVGNIRRSSTFIARHRSDTGLYDVDSAGSLPGLGSGIIMEVFQIAGSWEVLRDRL